MQRQRLILSLSITNNLAVITYFNILRFLPQRLHVRMQKLSKYTVKNYRRLHNEFFYMIIICQYINIFINIGSKITTKK